VTKNIRTFIALTLPILALALTPSVAMAQSFSGNWPMTENLKQFNEKNTYCLTLTDNSSAGFQHSGPATLNGSGFSGVSGIFQVVNNVLVATFYIGDDNGSLNGLVFVAPASKGDIGKGFGELVSGAETVTGALAFGTKNGC
jgi:hypothetical protein